MGFFGGGKEVRPEQKWDYISLKDFKSSNAFTHIAYAYVYVSLLISIAVYSVDTFTAVQLLAFNRWSSTIQPAVPFDITKWIFSICIILSFVNLAYEHIRAQRVMSRGSVAESFLDSLAVRLESVKMGNGQGWKRFLVFAELTKSKKGAEYVALFTFFSFQSWIRVIFCSGPRQAVNALTLYAVYNSKLQVKNQDFENSLMNFFAKIGELARQDYRQAVILSGMIFTFVVWVFAALSLLIAALFFVFFLWGWIPNSDGTLSNYCERKINKRLMAIVSKKINKGIAEQERQRHKAEVKAAKKTGGALPEQRKATLPVLMQDDDDDKLAQMPSLERSDTMATLPQYSSRPGTPGGYELSQMSERPSMPTRTNTMGSSSTAYSTNAPLLRAGAPMGRSGSPAPSVPSIDMSAYSGHASAAGSVRSPTGGPPSLRRADTSLSSAASGYGPPPSTYSTVSGYSNNNRPQPERSPTYASNGYSSNNSRPQPERSPTYASSGYSAATSRPNMPTQPRPSYGSDYTANGRSASPAPSYQSRATPGPQPGGYPVRSATGPIPNRGPPQQYPPPQRVGTAPPRPYTPSHQSQYSGSGSDYFNPQQGNGGGMNGYPPRPGTSNSQRPLAPRPSYGSGWGPDVEGQRGGGNSQY